MNLWNSVPKSVAEMKILAQKGIKTGLLLKKKEKNIRAPSPLTGEVDDSEMSKVVQGGPSSVENALGQMNGL